MKRGDRVCPVELAGGLDNRVRRWLQNPGKIVSPYISDGMTVLDVGCGPGFFTVEMAVRVGELGRVIAADLQDGMLAKLRAKIKGTELEDRITLHKCMNNCIGVTDKVDFVLLFYMVHEVPDKSAFFRELASILNPEGRILMVEPPFHVSKKDFADTLNKVENAGLAIVENTSGLNGKSVVMKPANPR